LYFTGTKADSIDLKNDVYVAGGGKLNLSAELRVSCEQNECIFNVGVIATRTGTAAVSTDVTIQVAKSGEKFTKTVNFAVNEKFKEVIMPIKLTLGKNQLVVTIDGNKTTTESDETNNSFAGTVMVNWKQDNPANKN
jgi:subtilase family serine protease